MRRSDYEDFDEEDNSGFLWDSYHMMVTATHKSTLEKIRAWDAMRKYPEAMGYLTHRGGMGDVGSLYGWDGYITTRENMVEHFIRMDATLYYNHIEPLFQFAIELGCVVWSQPRVFGGVDILARTKDGYEWYSAQKNLTLLTSDKV